MDTDSGFLAELALRELEEDKLDRAHPNDPRAARFSDSTTSGLESINTSRMEVVVGHTKRKQDACGVDPIKATEYIWNDDLASQILAAASENGAACAIFCRDGVGIVGAYDQVKAWDASTCIELHFNSASVVGKGTETLHGDSEMLKDWASMI